MAFLSIGAETDPSTSGIITPMWSEDSLKCWHKVYVTTIFYSQCKSFEIFGIFNKPYTFCPRDGCPSYFNRSFQSILCVVSNFITHGRQQPILCNYRLCPSILQDKAACTVSIFNLSFSQDMTDASGLLVSSNSRNGNAFKLFDEIV